MSRLLLEILWTFCSPETRLLQTQTGADFSDFVSVAEDCIIISVDSVSSRLMLVHKWELKFSGSVLLTASVLCSINVSFHCSVSLPAVLTDYFGGCTSD